MSIKVLVCKLTLAYLSATGLPPLHIKSAVRPICSNWPRVDFRLSTFNFPRRNRTFVPDMIFWLLHTRAQDPGYWVPYVVLMGILLLALARNVFEARFFEFLRMAISDKYIKVYRDPSYLLTSYSIFLFVVQLCSFSMLIMLLLAHLGITEKTNLRYFIRVFVLLFSGILIKFLLDRILGVIFKFEEMIDQFNLNKLTYRSYMGMLLFPLVCAFYFFDDVNNTLLYSLIAAILLINLITYLLSLRNYQNVIFGKFLYFILYLCLVEFSPYLLIYFLILKNPF